MCHRIAQLQHLFAMNFSISARFQTVVWFPILNGLGKSGRSLTHRQIVAGVTGKSPGG